MSRTGQNVKSEEKIYIIHSVTIDFGVLSLYCH